MPFRIYTAPVVTLIARPEFIEPQHLNVKWHEPGTDGEKLSEFAGRLCYMSQHNPAGKSTTEYIGNILKQAHGSVLEHANYSLLIEGVSRSLTHELVRHRAGFAFSQLSQRFVDESDCAFVVPPAIRPGTETFDRWQQAVGYALDAYRDLSEDLLEQYAHIEDRTARRKKAREAARSVLPNSTETKIVVTGNVRAWRHFLEMRGALGADAEIQQLAREIADALVKEAPAFFQDVAVNDTGITTEFRKV